MMTYRSIYAFAAVVAATVGAPLAAQDANSDVRCFMLSSIFVKAAPDEKGRQAAALARLYYLGRVDARLTRAQIKSAITAQGKTLDMATAGKAMNECVRRLDEDTKMIQAIGLELSKSVNPGAGK